MAAAATADAALAGARAGGAEEVDGRQRVECPGEEATEVPAAPEVLVVLVALICSVTLMDTLAILAPPNAKLSRCWERRLLLGRSPKGRLKGATAEGEVRR